MISKFQIRVGVLGHFLVGVAVASFVIVQPLVLLIFAVLIIFSVWRWRFLAVWAVFVLASVCGMVIFMNDVAADHLEPYFNQELEVSGEVRQVVARPRSSDLYVQVDVDELAGAVVMVSDFSLRRWQVGEVVQVNGILREVMAAFPDSQSYGSYLRMRGVQAVFDSAETKITPTGEVRASIWRWFFLGHEKIAGVIQMLFSGDEAGFLAGLLLGDRSGLSAEVKDQFRASGLSHIVAVSGYNVSLVLLLVSYLLPNVSRRWRAIFGIGAVVIFVCLIGFDASVVRAGIMGILGVLVVQLGRRPAQPWRQKQVLWLLLLAASFMVFWQPQALVFDVGFQLSFAATLGLVWLARPLQTMIARWVGVGNFLAELLGTAVAAQIATLPIVWWQFRQLYLIGLLANVVVVPFVSLATVGGIISLALYFFGGLLFARFMAWPELVLLKLILFLVKFFGGLE